MSILTGPEIRRLVELGAPDEHGREIIITPFDPDRCGANSYDVHLGDDLFVYDTEKYYINTDKYIHEPIDPLKPPPVRSLNKYNSITDPYWVLRPGRVYLASTREYTETRGLVPVIYGRSSIGRLGLFIHVTAGFGDAGFKGHWTLELVATQPIVVRPGMKIGQIIYHTIEGERKSYEGRYQNQPKEPVPSRFHHPDAGTP